jgi:hypothetical protein
MKHEKNTAARACRYLKSKNQFGSLEGGDEPFVTFDDANAIYWCVKSIGPVGADDGPVDPMLCRAGRLCYKAPDY